MKGFDGGVVTPGDILARSALKREHRRVRHAATAPERLKPPRPDRYTPSGRLGCLLSACTPSLLPVHYVYTTELLARFAKLTMLLLNHRIFVVNDITRETHFQFTANKIYPHYTHTDL
ncbi:hypothetical protein J6590_038853 [Homalodisca vitripennis]|nr:hypothetical protein J6590_038853 [Homalodisca vitripennis]